MPAFVCSVVASVCVQPFWGRKQKNSETHWWLGFYVTLSDCVAVIPHEWKCFTFAITASPDRVFNDSTLRLCACEHGSRIARIRTLQTAYGFEMDHDVRQQP